VDFVANLSMTGSVEMPRVLPIPESPEGFTMPNWLQGLWKREYIRCLFQLLQSLRPPLAN